MTEPFDPKAWDTDPDPRDLLKELWEALYNSPLTARPESPALLWWQCIDQLKALRRIVSLSGQPLAEPETRAQMRGPAS